MRLQTHGRIEVQRWRAASVLWRPAQSLSLTLITKSVHRSEQSTLSWRERRTDRGLNGFCLTHREQKIYWFFRGICLPFHYDTSAVHSLVFCYVFTAMQRKLYSMYVIGAFNHIKAFRGENSHKSSAARCRRTIGNSCFSCKSAYWVLPQSCSWCSKKISHFLKPNPHLDSWLALTFMLERKPNLGSPLHPPCLGLPQIAIFWW